MARILILDDDPHVRGLVPRLAYGLVGSAVEVVGAADEREALAICQAGPVEVVLADYFMPEQDGPEVVRRLRARFPKLRAVLMTGDAALAGKTLPESDLPVGDKADLEEVVRQAVELALGRL